MAEAMLNEYTLFAQSYMVQAVSTLFLFFSKGAEVVAVIYFLLAIIDNLWQPQCPN